MERMKYVYFWSTLSILCDVVYYWVSVGNGDYDANNESTVLRMMNKQDHDVLEFAKVWYKIEKNIEWDKVHTAMCALGWIWASSITPSGVPSIDAMKESVKKQLAYVMSQDIHNPGTVTQSSGGFRVCRVVREGKKDGYVVEFILTYVDVNCGLDEFCGTGE
jgi:hypothetical protein